MRTQLIVKQGRGLSNKMITRRKQEIAGLKELVEELRMKNCTRTADLICEDIFRLEEEGVKE
ncbi:MAG TPA: hypothetical protein VGE97_02890 [Nitrososphaera sp.]